MARVVFADQEQDDGRIINDLFMTHVTAKKCSGFDLFFNFTFPFFLSMWRPGRRRLALRRIVLRK